MSPAEYHGLPGGDSPSGLRKPRGLRWPLIFLLVGVVAVFGLTACDGGDTGPPGDSGATTSSEAGAGNGASYGDRITIDRAGEALVWGKGKSAVLLAHGAAFDAASWQPQAARIARAGNLVVSLEDIAPESILAAVGFLREDRSAASVALIGASAGADASLQALAMDPGAVDQLITLSVNSTADDLGDEPKLFIASEAEPVADLSTELAASSEGSGNEALILPGSAHAQAIFDGDQADRAISAIFDRLE